MPKFHSRRLPHLHVLDQPLFLTWRLPGSLPPNRFFPSTITSGRAFVAMDRILDHPRFGPLHLRQTDIAELVVDAMRYRQEQWQHFQFSTCPTKNVLDSGVYSRVYSRHGTEKARADDTQLSDWRGFPAGGRERRTPSVTTTRKSFLREPVRSEGGFRLFGAAEIEQLKFIRKAQELGFALGEIKELLVLQDRSVEACSHIRELLERKVDMVRQKIEHLTTLESGLKEALRKCNRSLKRAGDSHGNGCPVLKQIARPNDN